MWGSEGAAELLEWLGIPPRHQVTRDSMLDTRREDNALDGVVLLDLPDHDSTEVSHHLEVDRLVELADLLVWVLDPQKYADAAIHDRYLAPYATHQDVMLVVLNQIDRVPEAGRDAMVADVRRLLDAEGLARVPVLAVSAKEGLGIAELKAEIGNRVTAKKAARARMEADLKAAAARLDEASGKAKARSLPQDRVAALEDAFADAAGVPTVVDAVEQVHPPARQPGHRLAGGLVAVAAAPRPAQAAPPRPRRRGQAAHRPRPDVGARGHPGRARPGRHRGPRARRRRLAGAGPAVGGVRAPGVAVAAARPRRPARRRARRPPTSGPPGSRSGPAWCGCCSGC